MRRKGWSRGAFRIPAMLVVLGLAMPALAQEPAAQGPPPDQASYDTAQLPPGADPPSEVARLSVAQGNVSVEPASVNQFSPAEVNYPLTTGDRVWTDYDALAELQAGQLAVRMGQTTDLTVTAMTDSLAQFGLGQGSMHLRAFTLDPSVTTEVDTPNVAVSVLAPGDIRVDVEPSGDWTVVTVYTGVVEVDGNGLQQTVGAGQAARFIGTNPVSAQWLMMPHTDALDDFSSQRDKMYQTAEAAEQGYLNADTVGGADLEQAGTWQPEADYGAVWFPSAVPVGWQPYCYGRWTWVAPWGWTWIEAEPWGFAPFHYGRWAIFGTHWGWVPGPPVVHPVYAPALVVFTHPGNGVSAWFPLGPNEPYAPWYHASVLYQNRVNVSNLYNRNVNQVRTTYETSNRPVYANALATNRTFVNRGVATVAVPQQSFASGASVRGSMMRVPSQQLAGAPLIAHPMITPQTTMVSQGHAKALPPRVARPALTSHQDQAVRSSGLTLPKVTQEPAPVERRGANAAGTQPAGEPNQIEYRNTRPAGGGANSKPGEAAGATEPETTPFPHPVEQPAGNNAARGNQANKNAAANGEPIQRANPPVVPVTNQPSNAGRNATVASPQPPSQPTYQNGMAIGTQPNGRAGQQPSSGLRIQGAEAPPPNAVHGTTQRPQGTVDPRTVMPYNQPQQLYNRAVPPPARPSFEQQRQAIQSTDPGRPLGPQQLENLRQNRPAGPPQMSEPAPHPAAAPPPPPQRSSPPPPHGTTQQPRSDNRH